MARRTPVKLTPLRRHVAAIITIALSCAFVAVMVVAGNLMQAALSSQASQQYEGADLAIDRPLTDEDWTSESPLDPPQVDGTDQVWPLANNFVELEGAGTSTFLSVVMLPPGQAGADSLREGAAPAAEDEIVLDAAAAETLEIGVGDTITMPERMSPTGQGAELTVVGIAEPAEGSVFGGTPRVLVAPDHAETLLGPAGGTLTETWLATVPEGTDPGEIAAQSTSDEMTVRTAEEAVQQATDDVMQGFGFLGMLLGVFVAIALFTSAVVISNTFAVTIAQRTRSLALLRTVGATRSQVRSVVLREALLVGVLGALLGMIGGHLLVQAGLSLAAAVGWLEGQMIAPASALSVLLPLVAGVAITLGAMLSPMRAATRVAPLQALRPQSPVRRRGLGIQGILGIVAIVAGVAALGGGSALALIGPAALGILLAIAGGILSFAGILLVLVSVTRPLAAAAGAVAALLGGLPARIAAANVARNPRRSASTVAALLIGTTLMTMMAVGARTAEATLTSELDSRRPIDLVVSAEEMPEDAADRIAAIEGMDTVASAERGDIDVGAADAMTLYGASPETVREVSHRAEMADELVHGVVLLGEDRAAEFGLSDGQVLELTGADGGRQELRVRVDSNLQMSLVTPETLQQLVGEESSPVVLGDFADPGTPERAGVSVFSLIDEVHEVTAGEGYTDVRSQVGGAERESYAQILQVLLGITVALLAVAVLVALVGVANTLSLGVVERTGENALLRALGTTRSQMRAMLAWEGVLLALVGAVLGIAIGTVYGVLGINALLGSQFPITLTIPWGQVALVLVLAVLAGALASVLPGRAASRTAPAAALASAE
ncbi:MAG TPA: FtsX-like permease family protein [Candidatus Brachybacterium merdigallinarum]|nr:FtsX-like permease family protein [Candidatus Brachybacterium merdigallinarum]